MILKLFRNCRVYTPIDPGAPPKGNEQGQLRFWDKGALLVRDGLIEAVGDEREVLGFWGEKEPDLVVDCGGRCLIPGFVDPHTHMCFSTVREEEFSLRIAGTPYLEILKRGGGILSSVRSVREADERKLYDMTMTRVASALKSGSTTVEIKSGYGLDTQTELKMLKVIDRVGKDSPAGVVPTFLGAHAVPQEFLPDTDRYVDLVVEEMIPAVAEQGIARFCDVFCEEGVFSIEQSSRILTAAREAGLGIKIHADEVHDLGGAGLAAELGAISAEHLLAAGDANLEAMARAGVIAVLLPGTALSLKKPYARARKMIELGVAVALASDCNPGSCYIESMPLIFSLAVLNMDLTVEEALTAATLNAAYALGMADRVGSLDKGKQADFLLLEGSSPAYLAYRAGSSCVAEVYKKGERLS